MSLRSALRSGAAPRSTALSALDGALGLGAAVARSAGHAAAAVIGALVRALGF